MEVKYSDVEFFVPSTKSKEDTESFYQAIVSFNKPPMELNKNRIYKIKYRHNSQEFEETIGKVSKVNGEIVGAIFNLGSLFVVCTDNRGVLRGEPLLVEVPYYLEYFSSQK